MTDLTVLISPTPLYVQGNFSFCRPTPVMVTLEPDHSDLSETEVADCDSQSSSKHTRQPRRRGRAPNRIVDPNFLSPPVETFRARPKRHKPTRSQSAPPARLVQLTPSPPQPFVPDPPSTAINRSFPRRSFTSSYSEGVARITGTGDLLPPPPPLLRPTTFWRKTRRSGVTAASYSPSYHLIRRSTFIAAGLNFDSPVHDLSAFCVENRVGFIVVPDYSLQ
ncbi:hypothetical protein APHAL10511_007486 [Amanita phalloides]|nr:hypothetical protein APHAL10511_007486 [Amanita phalloides]